MGAGYSMNNMPSEGNLEVKVVSYSAMSLHVSDIGTFQALTNPEV